MAISTGDLVGERYRLVKRIGHGGMGDVWCAQDTTLDRPVAVKILSGVAARQRDTRAFLHEARMAAAVRHRNVVEVLDYGTHESSAPYIVMELLEGETLGDVFFREGRLTFEEIVNVAVGALHGLAAAHDAGIIHRDLKPENIFLARDRDSFYPKLLDFGISKSVDSQRPSPVVTQEGRVVGTPAYMSPEQARGLRDIDHRSDLYSMGVILFEALAGEPPFFDENPGDLMVKIITAPTPRLETTVPAVGKPLGDFVERAMHRVPELRYQSADEMRRALEFLARNQISDKAAHELAHHPRPPSWRQSQNHTMASFDDLDVEAGQIPRNAVEAVGRTTADTRQRNLRWPFFVAIAVLTTAVAVWLTSDKAPIPKPYVIKVQPSGDEPPTSAANVGSKPHVEPDPESAEEPAEPAAKVGSTSTPTVTAESRRPQTPRNRRRAKSRPRNRRATGSAPPSGAGSLSATFQQQKSGVVQCLRSSAKQLAQTSNMAIRFEIDAGGHVRDASVLPPELARTPTGRCMRAAAKAMRFAPQGEPLTFRIPLRAKSSG